MENIDISKHDKADVLAALYNNSKSQGMGLMYFDSNPMTKEEAQEILNEMQPDYYFDYLKGRVMKVDLSKDDMSSALYDRDNGPGAAQTAINTIQL